MAHMWGVDQFCWRFMQSQAKETTISQSGLTFDTGGEQTSGTEKYVVITAGTGNVSWS